MPPLLADFFHTGACKPICEKFLTRPPAKYLLFENFSKNFFGDSRAAKDDKNRPAGRKPTGRENALLCC